MPKLEIQRKSELSRKEVSDRLIALGQALASGSEVELGSGGDSIEIVVADRVRWELEIEVDGDETEIEISWTADAELESESPPPVKSPGQDHRASWAAAHGHRQVICARRR